MAWRTLVTATVVCVVRGALAQCGTCTPDLSCVSDPPLPTVCPQQAPDAVAGEPYDEQLTFWIPPAFADPTTGLQVTVQEVRVTNVSGVPLGLDFQTDSPDQVYLPQVAPHGCVRVCGTPVLPGTYTASVSVDADVLVGGFPLTVPQSLGFSLVVQPGVGGNSGFTFTPTFGCAPLSVDLRALIGGPGLLVDHQWTLGNGSTATGDTVQTTYTAAGSYPIDLRTTIQGPMLTALTVTGVNTAWCGDIEEPSVLGQCLGAPDLFFVLRNASGVVLSSPVAQDETSYTWSGLDILLTEPPYTITVLDLDPFFDANDTLGTIGLGTVPAGELAFADAGTTGTLTVAWTTLQVLDHQDTVRVFPPPPVVLAPNATNDSLCVGTADLLAVEWTLNGAPVNVDGLCVAATPGTWSVTVTDVYGCSNSASIQLADVGITALDGPGQALRIIPMNTLDRVLVVSSWNDPSRPAVLSVFDTQGRTLHQQTMDQRPEGHAAELDLSPLSPGIHLLRVSDGIRSAHGRVLVLH